MADNLRGRYEVEVKLRIDNPDQAKKRIVEFGALPRFIDNQEHDLCFDYPDKSLLSKKKYLILRERKPFGENLLFFKGDNDNSIDLTTLVDYDATHNILIRLGLVKILELTKLRSMFLKDEFHIVVDTLEGYGHFIEVGSMTDDPTEIEQLEIRIKNTVKALGYSSSARERRSYRQIVGCHL